MMTGAEYIIQLTEQINGDAVSELDRIEAAARGTSSALKAVDKSAALMNQKMAAAATATQKGGVAAALASTKFGELSGAFGQLGGPLGNAASMAFAIGDSFQKLGQSGGPMALVAGVAALGAAAFIALGAALAAAAGGIAAMGIKAANAARDTRLLYEATLGSSEAAAALTTEFRQLEKTTGASRDRLWDVSKQLKVAGLEGADASAALKAIAMQEAAIGTDGTAALIGDLKSGKKSAAEMAREIESKFGGVVEKRMMGLGQTSDRLQGNFAALFSGLDIEGFLSKFAAFTNTFDETTASGRVMKGLFETVFQPLVDGAAAAFPYISLFIQQFINQGLKIAIAFKPVVTAVSELFGIEPNDAMTYTMKAAEVAATALAISVGSVIAVFAVLGLAAQQVGSAFLAAWAMAKAAWTGVSDAVTSAIDTIKGMSLADVGAMLIDGFVNGIKSGAGKVRAAVGELGSLAKGALMTAIDAGSPAREFMDPGRFTAQGYAIGIEEGSAEVEQSISNMISGGGALPVARGGTGGPTNVTLHFHGVTDRDLVARVRREVEDIFVDLSLGLGGSPTAEAT